MSHKLKRYLTLIRLIFNTGAERGHSCQQVMHAPRRSSLRARCPGHLSCQGTEIVFSWLDRLPSDNPPPHYTSWGHHDHLRMMLCDSCKSTEEDRRALTGECWRVFGRVGSERKDRGDHSLLPAPTGSSEMACPRYVCTCCWWRRSLSGGRAIG